MSTLAPWQQRVLDGALASLADARLGHALLFAGPARMGKEAVARHLAARLLCSTPGADGLACGACRGCQLLAAGTHPDFRFVSFIPNDKGDKLRSEIIVDQMRDLGHWFSLTPQMGGAQVALVSPAHALNTNAANALLKTLEEPSQARYLLLVSDHPGRLPATIRSRCQRLDFRPPARAEGEAWLRSQGHEGTRLSAALDAARGHPGLAADWLAEGGLALRSEVQSDLNALADGRQAPVPLAQRWLADGQGELRLRFAAELVLDGMARQLGATAAPGLTLPPEIQKLAPWFDAINRARDQLAVPVLRHDLALAGLLLEWRSMFKDTARQGARR
ncbi:MAG TPA: DNA polymerase III subunit delta' [Arenimonas sp.]|uniref:DNA polymerase III subunit delta' n=1 Tax=Arenimonas sp. TaxID=1872635 RepID=UPI002D7EB64F|nr:DNA polymerase III subunit delta' [Arenimonas sp.]HEU0153103.1 DNA polymerase III subunit delta' [Arenimonas sp.]